ncbi:hypothetical protein Q4520_06750 [Alteromonas sp. 1_MG-2023]|uniref:sulfotransferase family protein n=1 Tax=Alteromonas sp. 1_MG-2023 TaxID=3062669 RepID=UPI0026E42D87|nr:hypothetical protein [Alteromonas sp. 1_MG-2023]MDO6475110.1 hypothetical protein [Alteromonas sp. 1_MG-2023]
MEQKAVIVIGMHRSGTSAVSGMLAELGVFMGSALFAPQKGVNEKGFYENSYLVNMNEKLLDEALWSWDDPLAQNMYAAPPENGNHLLDEAVKVLESDYGKQSCWGMKDPRTTLLLPFWQQVFDKMALSPFYLLMVRSPFEVYGSLKKRDDFSADKSLMLWLNYTLTGYFCSQGKPRYILSYHTLLERPEEMAKAVSDAAGLNIDVDALKLGFVDKKMRNQKSVNVPEGELSDIAAQVYNALTAPETDHDKLVALSARYQAYLDNLSPVLVEHLLSLKKQEVYFRRHFLEAYESLWWKVSWPLKKLEQFVKSKK